ncbi:MAG TPA: hypothetical protein VF681_08315 [Abditibacteriaceae bacterium]|jgi:hypothetical protein
MSNETTSSSPNRCLSCAGENAPDSRFCRHCGAALEAKPVAATAVATSAAASTVETKAPATPAPEKDETLSPAEIDARRARQLLDRALALSDKGDKAGAIIACRQAIGLAPRDVAPYAMLGPLLERSGDSAGAMAVYEIVLALKPSSPIERDSLARLRAAASQKAASRPSKVFHFDENELFSSSDTSAAAPAAAAASVAAVSGATATGSQPVAAPSVTASVVAPTTTLNSAAAPVRSGAAPTSPFGVPPISATPVAGAIPNLSFPDAPVTTIPRWVRAIRGEGSYWMQSAPLMVTALLGLGFLLWARGVAASRAETPVLLSQTGEVVDAQPLTPGVQPATGANPANANAPTFPVSNDRSSFAPAAPAAPNAPAGTTPRVAPGTSAPRTASPGVPPRGEAPRQATLPRQPQAPRANRPEPSIAPASPSSANPNESNPFGGMRPVASSKPSPRSETVRALPMTSQPAFGTGTGGPTNPSGAGPRGYIRITGPNSTSAPARPESRSRAAEAAAREEARAGRTGSAISSATNSIEGGRDTGWRYQNRALLFLEQGDNARAADDFKTAIAAYRDQINRNINVDQARAGIDACQSGLRLAQARLR